VWSRRLILEGELKNDSAYDPAIRPVRLPPCPRAVTARWPEKILRLSYGSEGMLLFSEFA